MHHACRVRSINLYFPSIRMHLFYQLLQLLNQINLVSASISHYQDLSNVKETQIKKKLQLYCSRDIMLDPNRASDKFPYLTIHVCTLPCEKKTKYTDFFTDPQKNVVTSQQEGCQGYFFFNTNCSNHYSTFQQEFSEIRNIFEKLWSASVILASQILASGQAHC